MMSRYSQSTKAAALVILGAAGLLAAQQYVRSVHYYAPPPVRLIDSSGRTVDLQTVLAHRGPVILQFIFTTCSAICPVLTSTTTAAQARLGSDLLAISITIDPEYDTPARLAEYSARFHTGPDSIFLTGPAKDIAAVQRAFDAEAYGKMNHRPLTFLHAAPTGPWVRLEGFTTAAELVTESRRAASR